MIKLPAKEEIKLVALDLDGTVICPKGQSPVSLRTRHAVANLMDAGVPVTFVTGRTEDYARALANEFGLQIPLVTYNGARIYSTTQSKILHEFTIDSRNAVTLTDWLEELDEVVALYLSREGRLHLYQSRCSGSPDYDDHLFGTPRILVDRLSNEIRVSGSTVSKMIVMTQRSLEEEVSSRFPQAADAVRTHPDLIEILPVGVSKGKGVLRLCQMLEIDPKQVLAIGDQDNDISTFEICGFSVAMGDAPEHVKKAADTVTGTFEEDGCASFLERLL